MRVEIVWCDTTSTLFSSKFYRINKWYYDTLKKWSKSHKMILKKWSKLHKLALKKC